MEKKLAKGTWNNGHWKRELVMVGAIFLIIPLCSFLGAAFLSLFYDDIETQVLGGLLFISIFGIGGLFHLGGFVVPLITPLFLNLELLSSNEKLELSKDFLSIGEDIQILFQKVKEYKIYTFLRKAVDAEGTEETTYYQSIELFLVDYLDVLKHIKKPSSQDLMLQKNIDNYWTKLENGTESLSIIIRYTIPFRHIIEPVYSYQTLTKPIFEILGPNKYSFGESLIKHLQDLSLLDIKS